MIEPSFSFNGIKKNNVITEEGRKRQIYNVKRNLLYIPGMRGALLESTDKEVKVIQQPITIAADSKTDLRKLEEDLAAWLITDDPRELIFDDEPDRLYSAVVDGTLDLDELINWGQGTITFICFEKYGVEKSVEIAGTGTFNVEGTAETPPNVKIELKKDTTFVAVSDGEKINLVGMPIEVAQQPFVREERKFWHECNTTVGWTKTEAIEGGLDRGALKSNGFAFWTDDYGTDSGWHGPALKTSLGTTIQDFQLDALISQMGSSGQVGSIEIDLLDVNNQIITKMLMTKRAAGSQANWARLRAGNDAKGYNIIDFSGKADWVWSNFEGLLRIGHVGSHWFAYVARVDAKGNQDYGMYKTWPDDQGLYTAPVAQIQVQLWQFGAYTPTAQRIDDLKVYRINSPGGNEIPYIGRAGDVIEFDHQTSVIRRNGEDITKEKAFIGEYFPLKPGINTLVVEPADAINKTEVRWKPIWW